GVARRRGGARRRTRAGGSAAMLAAAGLGALLAAAAGDAAARVWRLADPAPPAGAETTTLAFADGGRVAGQAPCNRYFAEARRLNGRIRVLGLGATRKLCPPEIMAAERAYFDALRAARRIRRSGAGLALVDGLGATRLRFEPIAD
ncbi:MAG: META domain-containing protein, partial [Pseudomonadota bacterium]